MLPGTRDDRYAQVGRANLIETFHLSSPRSTRDTGQRNMEPASDVDTNRCSPQLLLIAPAHAAASSWARRSETDPSAGLTADCAAEEFRGSLERMLKVDQVHVIRHKVLVEGRSQRQVAKD